jgi:CDP-diacylglycerol--glycerol-3-phosphate 3-phosphatidyltransferase
VPITAPNLLTLFRIVLIPVLVVAYYMPVPWAHILVTGLFVLSGITDWLDGYLARRLNQHSSFGAFLDPIADKLTVSTALVLLAADPRVLAAVIDPRLYAVVIAIIIGREIIISGLREWMAILGQRARMAVSYIAKIKTALQMLAVGVMLYREPLLGLPILRIGELLLYVAAALTIWSMLIYMRSAWPRLAAGEKAAGDDSEAP